MKKKFYIRLFAVYICIALLYTFMLVGTFFYKNNEITQLRLNSGYQQFLEQSRDKIDTNIMIGNNLLNRIVTDKHIIEYIKQSGIDFYSVTNVFNVIKMNTTPFSDVGVSIAIAKMDDNLVITPKHTKEINSYYKEMGFSGTFIAELNDFILEKRSRTDYIITNSVSESGDNNITMVKKQQTQGENEMVIFLSFLAEKMLPTFDAYGENAFAILSEDNILAIKTNIETQEISQMLSNKTIEDTTTETYDPFNYNMMKTGDYSIHFINSQELDWRYVFITSQKTIRNESMKLLFNALLIYMLITGISIIIVFLITNRMYKPISKIVNIFEEYDYKDEYDELSFIQKSVAKTKDTNMKLSEALNNNRRALEHKFLKDLLYGLVQKENIQEQINKYGLDWMYKNIYVAIVEVVNHNELVEVLSKEDLLMIKSHIGLFIEEHLGMDMKCKVVEIDYKKHCIIMELQDIDTIKKLLSNVVSNIEINFEVSMMAGVGEVVDSVYKIETSFNDALRVLESRLINDKRAVVTFEDLEDIKNELYYYPLNVEKDLIDFTIKGMKDNANLILNNILNENFIKRKLSREILSQFIFAIVVTINRILQQMGKSADEIFEDGMITYVELKMYENNIQLCDKIMEIFDTMIQYTGHKNQQKDNTLAEKMVGFVYENYDKDLSLTDLAERFNLSTGYISTLFKTFAGENFKDFLNIYRVEKAKEILDNKNIKIKELAEAVGCNNSTSFIRIFKRYTGVSPGQYLKSKSDE